MIPAHIFTKAGKELLVGKQLRINHDDCPMGRDSRGRLYIKRKDIFTILAYCHNCGDYGVHSTQGKTRAIRDLLVENEVVQRDGAGELVLPDDVMMNPSSWPEQANHWLDQYGIRREECIDNQICYSPSWHRLILPVYENGKLVFWQGRALDAAQEPKYVSAKAHPKVMFWFHSSGRIHYKIIIVEDMLSAIKLGRFVDTVALLGTNPDINCLTERLQNYTKVGILLDPDHAGASKSRELEARMSLVFMGQVRRFYEYLKQPKEMTNAELEKLAVGL